MQKELVIECFFKILYKRECILLNKLKEVFKENNLKDKQLKEFTLD